MKIKRLAVLFLSLVVALGTAFAFGCGSAHKHVYDYVCNAEKHWQECICGEVKKNTEEAHAFENKVCTTCEQTEFTSGLEFTKIVDGKDYVYHVSGYNGTATEVIIPNAICSKPVTGVAHRAFKDCTGITSINIPDSITYFGDYVFEGCTSLKYYESNGIQYLGNAFNPYIYLARSTDKTRSSAVINSACQFVGSGAFEGHQNLNTVDIPKSIKGFAKEAFRGCSSAFTKVNFLGTADEWAQLYFSEGSANPVFYSKKLYICGELLVNLTLTVPVISDYAFFDCDSMRTLTLSEGVTHIGVSAFEGCNSFTSSSTDGYTLYFDDLDLPESIVYIGHSAFRYCANLKKVVIPASTEYIGVHAFADCVRLGKIVYNGTTTEWNEMFVGERWNERAKAVQVQCSNGVVSIGNN